MPDNPAQATVKTTVHIVGLAVTGQPDVDYKYDTGRIRPREIEIRYHGRSIRAQVYGLWVREDGELTDQPCDQDYTARYGDIANWPTWLADLARAHSPDAVPPAVDRTASREQVAEILTPFFANFSDDDTARVNAGEAANALAAVLPARADRAAVLGEAATTYEEILENAPDHAKDPRYWTAVRDVTLGLRRMADETPQPTGHVYLSTGCLHGEHRYCQNVDGIVGLKKPAQCKFCAAPCVCLCHTAAAPAVEAQPDGEA
jgi:hypothetical protein